MRVENVEWVLSGSVAIRRWGGAMSGREQWQRRRGETRRSAAEPVSDWPTASTGGTTRDGLVGVYAERVIERGVDPRLLAAECRGPATPRIAQRGSATIAYHSPAATAVMIRRVGRGTPAHRSASRAMRDATPRRSSHPRSTSVGDLLRGLFGTPRPARTRGGRRLVTAGIALALLLGSGIGIAAAQEAPPQQLYAVQPGDTVESVASTFGVDPAAILAASAISAPPWLNPGEVVVVPAPGQSPNDAARMATELQGTRPYVSGAHLVTVGETLAGIANLYGVSPQGLSELNGLTAPDALSVGQRLLIPPVVGSPSEPATAEPGVVVPPVPAYVQQRNLSCEYAAAYIATSAFGAGVAEWVFMENVPAAQNPHWGYRGDIDGWWGNTDDYGVYAEALVPTLNANGYAGEVFYSQGDPAALTARLDAGLPVLTWLGYWGDTGVTLDDEGVYTVAAGMHVVVAYGYDEWGVHVSDPAQGSYRAFPWSEFTAMWSVLDGMSLAVSPL